MTNTRPRLAALVSHPIQYYSPWFRWIAAHCPVELRVFYLWDFGLRAQVDPQFGTPIQWDTDLVSGYAWELVPNVARRPGTDHFFGLRNPELPQRLASWRPDALLTFGYRWAGMLRGILWARRHRIPMVFRGDSHFLGRPAPGRLRGAPLRWLYRQFAAVTYVGEANRRYFEALGVPPARLFFAPHVVDDAQFRPDQPAVQAAARELRQSLGVAPGEPLVLFAGKFVPAKQPAALLQAFLEARHPTAWLLFAGDGGERPALEGLAQQHPGARVRFLPFANQSQMPARYLAADLLVLPSRGAHESWGLAVNEAMHMGTPALVSDRVGCHENLVLPERTGWVFRADDPTDLRRQLAAALAAVSDPRRREVLRSASRRHLLGYTFAQASEGLISALAFAAPAAGS